MNPIPSPRSSSHLNSSLSSSPPFSYPPVAGWIITSRWVPKENGVLQRNNGRMVFGALLSKLACFDQEFQERLHDSDGTPKPFGLTPLSFVPLDSFTTSLPRKALTNRREWKITSNDLLEFSIGTIDYSIYKKLVTYLPKFLTFRIGSLLLEFTGLMVRQIYLNDPSFLTFTKFKFKFQTPTFFQPISRKGRLLYFNLIDIYQHLAKRWNSFSLSPQIEVKPLLDWIETHVRVTSFHLKIVEAKGHARTKSGGTIGFIEAEVQGAPTDHLGQKQYLLLLGKLAEVINIGSGRSSGNGHVLFQVK